MMDTTRINSGIDMLIAKYQALEAENARLRADNDMLRKVNAEQAERLADKEYET